MPASPTSVARRVAAAATLVAALALAPTAAAAPVCVFDPLSGRVTLTLAAGEAGYLAIGEGDAILVDPSGTPCADATRLLTTSIAVFGQPGSTESLLVDVGGGAFAGPGPVPQVSAPIAFEVDLGGASGADRDVVRVAGSAAAEVLSVAATTPAVVSVDETGQPTLRLVLAGGSPPGLELAGGAGHDELLGSAEGETLDGGAGDDRLEGGPGDDRYVFGSAVTGEVDLVVEPASGGYDTLDLADATDGLEVALEAPSAVLASGRGRVVLAASGSELESVVTGSGPDTVVGSPWPDAVRTGAGDDAVDVTGGGTDSVSCGDGADAVRADETDVLGPDCERAPPAVAPGGQDLAPIAPPPVAVLLPVTPSARVEAAVRGRRAPRRAPAVSIGGRSLRLTPGGRVEVLIRCPSVAHGPCRLGVDLRAARSLRLPGGRTTRRLGRVTRSIPRAHTRVVVVQLASAVHRAIRRRGDLHVVVAVTVRDGTGRARTTRKQFVLRTSGSGA